MLPLDVVIPYQRTDLVSLVHERGVIENEEFAGDGTHILGRIPRALAPQFTPFAAGK
jgi:GTP-binding protein HflX